MSDVRMDFVLIEGSQPIGSLHMTNVTVLLFLQNGNKCRKWVPFSLFAHLSV